MRSGPDVPSSSFSFPEDGSGAASRRDFRHRRRNRHGRGFRGDVFLPTLPGYRTRSDRFDDMVLDTAERLHDLQGKILDGVLFAVEEIPPGLEELLANGLPAPLGNSTPALGEEPARVTVYRRVVEQNCPVKEQLPDLVHDVVVEHTAQLLGVAPETLDPYYHRGF
ncbi:MULTISPECIES: metallopeptidase family protein [Arthrobacter]|uniref:Metallopeptidase family protein n=2 Tax=Arthrobacter TaxID=1663 RepID=A0ABU9KKD1_9MICC|nr:metallopeptidase family protein [Arthrobacter sp. YJM1]MDP5227360.1 metallopeptidase family protein [Arthrobacter sp. YJM1]